MHVAASDWCHDHVESALVGYVCIIYISPLVGFAFVLKSFLLCMWKFVMCTSFAPVIYIYILLFCGDPFFHLRAHPTPDDDVGREDGVGSSRP